MNISASIRALRHNNDFFSDMAFYSDPFDLILSKPLEAIGGMVKAPFVSACKVAYFAMKLFFDVIVSFGSCCNAASMRNKIRQIGLDVEGIARNTIRMIPVFGAFIAVFFDSLMHRIVSSNNDPGKGSSVSICEVLRSVPSDFERVLATINATPNICILPKDFSFFISDLLKYMAEDIDAVNNNAIRLSKPIQERTALVDGLKTRLDLVRLEDTSGLNFTVVKSLLDFDIEIIGHLLEQYKTLEIPIARERKIEFMKKRLEEMVDIRSRWDKSSAPALTIKLYKIFLQDALFWRDIDTLPR
jgi:hypothetical protein